MGVYRPIVDIPGNAGSANKLSADSGSAPSYGCRAWCNFIGSGTASIRASGNCSSLTDNGAGDWTVNLTTALPDTNFAAIVSMQQNGASGQTALLEGARTTSTIRVISQNTNISRSDSDTFCVALFR